MVILGGNPCSFLGLLSHCCAQNSLLHCGMQICHISTASYNSQIKTGVHNFLTKTPPTLFMLLGFYETTYSKLPSNTHRQDLKPQSTSESQVIQLPSVHSTADLTTNVNNTLHKHIKVFVSHPTICIVQLMSMPVYTFYSKLVLPYILLHYMQIGVNMYPRM